jgi:hypothetical protein
MKLNVSKELNTLRQMTMRELRSKFAEVFGEATPAGNRVWLIRRIIWRLQALAEGDLSERARRRAEELANDADLRLNPPQPSRADELSQERLRSEPSHAQAGNGLPAPGTVLTRVYKGETLQVKVLDDGFEFDSQRYASLSAVAKAVTGTHTSGMLFFRLAQKGGRS